MKKPKRAKKTQSPEDILKSKEWLEQREKSAKYISKEFQKFGLIIAEKLDDLKHKALYIKLAKNENRALLLKALSFADDYPQARSKGKIFMWKLKELREARSKN